MTEGSAAPVAVEGGGWVDSVARRVLGSLVAAGHTASADEARPTAALDDEGNATGGLPLAVLAAGLVLVAIGLGVGAARARGAGPWHPPGSRPDSM